MVGRVGRPPALGLILPGISLRRYSEGILRGSWAPGLSLWRGQLQAGGSSEEGLGWLVEWWAEKERCELQAEGAACAPTGSEVPWGIPARIQTGPGRK